MSLRNGYTTASKTSIPTVRNSRVFAFWFKDSASQQMPQLLPLRFQIPFVVWIGFHFDRHLLDDLQTVALQPDNFFRIVRQQANGFQAEVNENLRAKPVFTQIHLVTELQ